MVGGNEIHRVHHDFKINELWVKNFTIDSKSVFTKSASIWYNMRKRCVNVMKVKYSAYQDVTCSENFKNFQYFAGWCNNQRGYHNTGWELDKDILLHGNRVYSENNCVFVPQSLNSLLVKPRNSTSKLPQGVFPIRGSKLFKAVVNNKGTHEYLGCFSEISEARVKYLERKSEICLEHVDLLEGVDVDVRVLESLKDISERYLSQIKELRK